MSEIAKLLAPPSADTAPFPPDSRYHGLPLQRMTLSDGREVAFVGRRFLPPLDKYETIAMKREPSAKRNTAWPGPACSMRSPGCTRSPTCPGSGWPSRHTTVPASADSMRSPS